MYFTIDTSTIVIVLTLNYYYDSNFQNIVCFFHLHTEDKVKCDANTY